MHEKAFAALLREVIRVGKLVRPWNPTSEWPLGMWGTRNGFVEFRKEDLGQYHALVARFLRHADWAVRFSDVFVGEKVRRILEVVQSSSEQEVSILLAALIAE